jgi:hypothetical protein
MNVDGDEVDGRRTIESNPMPREGQRRIAMLRNRAWLKLKLRLLQMMSKGSERASERE